MELNVKKQRKIITFQSLTKYPGTIAASGIVITKDNVCKYVPDIRNRDDAYIHCHDYYELEYITSGDGRQWINGYNYVVKKGDVIFFRLKDMHDYESFHDMKLINCCFLPDLLPEIKLLETDTLGGVIVHLSEKEQIEFETLLYMLEKECMENKEYCNEASQHYIQLLLIFLKRTGYMRKQDGRRWSDLFMYLSEHYKTVTLDEVAEQMHISKNYFCRSFREKTGTTFLAYVNNLRIKAAIEQLLYTDMLISEIWRSVGFTQSKQFYKLFYNETGYTPGEFREAWKEHPEMIMNNSSQA